MAPKNQFCVGPNDDVTFSSLDYDPSFNIEGKDVYRAMFYGLGSDGTVGANKNTIKIIGTETDNSAQGYFVYDSKKSGSITTCHLRFGKNPVVAPYLINKANFIACHNFTFLEQVRHARQPRRGRHLPAHHQPTHQGRGLGAAADEGAAAT